jgi:hypothetical protein
MREKKLFTKSLALLGILTIIFSAAYRAAAEPMAADPSLKGAFTRCSYKPPPNPGYLTEEVWYPCETAKGPFAATTLMAGFFNSHDDMRWLAYHLVTHGYIILGMTPTDVMGNNPLWTEAHKAGIAMLKSEIPAAIANSKALSIQTNSSSWDTLRVEAEHCSPQPL